MPESPPTSPADAAGRPSPPPASVAFLLASLGRRTRELVESRLGEQGLSFHHLSALGHLAREPGVSYSELARRAGVSVQSMQSTVAALQERGLVERASGGGQGRRAALALTDDGQRALWLSEAGIRAVDDQLLAGIGAEERVVLERSLLRLLRTVGASRD